MQSDENLNNIDNNEEINLSSLFGDKDFSDIDPFVYDQELAEEKNKLSKSAIFPKIINKLKTRKTEKLVESDLKSEKQKNFINKYSKPLVASVLLLVSSFSVYAITKNSDQKHGDIVFNPKSEAIIKVASQNLKAKKELIRSEVKSLSLNLADKKGFIKYSLNENDTLELLSKKAKVDIKKIKDINNLKSNEDLSKRKEIIIPKEDFVIHSVRSGETLDIIARKYKVNSDKIVNINNINNPHMLRLKQPIIIPGAKKKLNEASKVKIAKLDPNKSSVHKLAAGETLGTLSLMYGVSVKTIMAVNGISRPDLLQINQKIIIPSRISRSISRTRRAKIAHRSLSSGNVSGRLVWPVFGKGVVTSKYGWRKYRYHRGIDIAAPYGTKLLASHSGKVVYSGWMSGYGRLIEIESSNGIRTKYAHCQNLYYKVGQYVKAGQTIATIGMTGRTSGPHVHFEVTLNGRHKNPKYYF